MSKTMNEVFKFLHSEPYGSIDDRVLSALKRMFGGRDIGEVGNMSVHVLVGEITARREECDLPADVEVRDVAQDLLKYMREMEFVAINQPEQTIRLVQDKHPRDMNLRELLGALRADPSTYDDLLPHIKGQDLVMRAERRTPLWAVPDSASRLDVEATLTRLKHAANDTIVQEQLGDGRYPITLALLFGQVEQYMINPFARSLEETAVLGPILAIGTKTYHLKDLPEERHLAYIWAVFVCNSPRGHALWPETIDLFRDLPGAFAPELSPDDRWYHIVEAYKAAKQADPTLVLTRFAPAPGGSGYSFGGNAEPVRDEAWYEAELRKRCGRTGIDIGGGARHENNRILPEIRLGGGTIRCTNVIVLDLIKVGSGALDGTVRVHYDTKVQIGSGVATDIRYVSWKELYEKAIEFGIFTV